MYLLLCQALFGCSHFAQFIKSFLMASRSLIMLFNLLSSIYCYFYIMKLLKYSGSFWTHYNWLTSAKIFFLWCMDPIVIICPVNMTSFAVIRYILSLNRDWHGKLPLINANHCPRPWRKWVLLLSLCLFYIASRFCIHILYVLCQ